MNTYNIQSNAKINLFFSILGIRPDNYCDIYSLMLPINFFDKIKISIIEDSNKDNIFIQRSELKFDEKSNTILSAINYFKQSTNRTFSVEIDITKNIPIGGGLGGGSSNAAHVLLALNSHFNNILSQKELENIALKIGCDVPFFIYNKPLIASGVGEVLTPVKSKITNSLRNKKILIFRPDFQISTIAAYKNFKANPQFAIKNDIDYLLNSNDDDLCGRLIFNSFSEIIFNEFQELRNLFLKLAAIGMRVGISGSGSCCFILANKSEDLSNAIGIIKNAYGDNAICGEFNVLDI